MTDTTEQTQSRTPRRVDVRTNIQASWTERGRGEEGGHSPADPRKPRRRIPARRRFDDMEPMLPLFRASDHATFDLDRKVLMFGTLKVK